MSIELPRPPSIAVEGLRRQVMEVMGQIHVMLVDLDGIADRNYSVDSADLQVHLTHAFSYLVKCHFKLIDAQISRGGDQQRHLPSNTNRALKSNVVRKPSPKRS